MPVPANEQERLHALQQPAVLDSAPEEVFDDIAWLASRCCDAPIALISLIDAERQWLEARRGLEAAETPREVALCAHTILASGILEVPDTLEDERFRSNPVVLGSAAIRFYAGAPLTGSTGHRYGALCVIDNRPRRLEGWQKEALQRLARQVVHQLEARQARLEAGAKEQTLAHLLEAMPDGVVSCGADGLLGEFNRTARDWHGIDPRALPAEQWAEHFDLFEPDGARLLATERIPLRRAWEGEVVREAEMVIKTAGQPARTVLCNAEPLTRADGTILGAVCVMHDVSRLKATAAQLANSEERLRVTLTSIGDAVLTTDTGAKVSFANPVAERLLGRAAANLQGRPITGLFSAPDDAAAPLPCLVAQVMQPGAPAARCGEAAILRPDGSRIVVEQSASAICDAGKAVVGAVLVFRDVTSARALVREIGHQARHDPLTDLANRREFESQLRAALAESGAPHSGHVLLYIDLDRFKAVNDSCGHAAGDAILEEVAVLLRAGLRATDLLARVGGDEFAVLLRSCPPEAAARIADGLCAAVRKFGFQWQGRSFRIGASIGLVRFAPGASLEGVLGAADAACYKAKEQGRDRVFAA